MRDWFVSNTAREAAERLKYAEARVELLKKELEAAQHTLAVLRDPWAGLEQGSGRLFERDGRTFLYCMTESGRTILEVVK